MQGAGRKPVWQEWQRDFGDKAYLRLLTALYAWLYICAPGLPLRRTRTRARPISTTRTARPLRPNVRPLELERLAAVELGRVAPGRAVAVRSTHYVEVGGDTGLTVQIRPARAVDLHPHVHEGLCVREREGGSDGGVEGCFAV